MMTLVYGRISLSLFLSLFLRLLVSLSILFHRTVLDAARQIYFIRILVMGAFPMEQLAQQPLFATFYRGTGSILAGEKKRRKIYS